MAKSKQECEVCEASLEADVEEVYGCVKCARLFGPCCNSIEDDICVECVS